MFCREIYGKILETPNIKGQKCKKAEETSSPADDIFLVMSLLEQLGKFGGELLATGVVVLCHDVALAVDEIHRRHCLHMILVCHGRREEVWPLQLLFFHRLLPGGGVLVDGDAHYLKALVFVEGILLLHVRNLSATWTAPGCPEIQDHVLLALEERLQGMALTCLILHGEVGHFLTHLSGRV